MIVPNIGPLYRGSSNTATRDGEDYSGYINDMISGNLDYDRTLEIMNKTQAYNSAENELQRQWYTNLSNTAYQRQAADLRAAGYNPALVLGGSGASSAYGSASSIGSYSSTNSAAATATAYSARVNAAATAIASLLKGVSMIAAAA